MSVFQDIGDLLLLALFTPPWGWIGLLGLLFVTGMIVLAIREARSTEEGKQKWRNYTHSSMGKKKIVLATVFAVITVAMLLRFMTSGSHGYCTRKGKEHTDEQFIKAALASDAKFIFKLDDPNKVMNHVLIGKLVNDYYAKYPDCCKVFRERRDEVGSLSWLEWRNGVVVRIRDEQSLKAYRNGIKRLVDYGLIYVWVDNCSLGTDIIPEITPGG